MTISNVLQKQNLKTKVDWILQKECDFVQLNSNKFVEY